jgi:hypothetical protein
MNDQPIHLVFDPDDFLPFPTQFCGYTIEAHGSDLLGVLVWSPIPLKSYRAFFNPECSAFYHPQTG